MPYDVEGEGVAGSRSWETRAVKGGNTRHGEDGLCLLARGQSERHSRDDFDDDSAQEIPHQ